MLIEKITTEYKGMFIDKRINLSRRYNNKYKRTEQHSSKRYEKTLTELKGEIDSSTIIGQDFCILLEIMGRPFRQ